MANADYSFTPSSSFTLQPSTSYWLYVYGLLGGNFDWRGSSPGVVPTGAATYGPGNLFTANGTTWTTSATINTFLIEGTAIPAPAALALLGLAGLVGSRRRRA